MRGNEQAARAARGYDGEGQGCQPQALGQNVVRDNSQVFRKGNVLQNVTFRKIWGADATEAFHLFERKFFEVGALEMENVFPQMPIVGGHFDRLFHEM